MAEAKLNFNESALDQDSSLYNLYTRLYEGMRNAALVDAPDFTENPPLTPSGEIDAEAINQAMSAYTTIQMKNAAYMMANSIVSSVGSGEGSGSVTGDFVTRSGDNMTGRLAALYGFQGGVNGQIILDLSINASNQAVAYIYGNAVINGDMTLSGKANVSSEGLYFNGRRTLYYDESTLRLDAQAIAITSDMSVNGSLSVGNITISESGIFNQSNEYYHHGNANIETADWTMKDAYVHNLLMAKGNAHVKGSLEVDNGFLLGCEGMQLLYSAGTDVVLNSDLSLTEGNAIKLGNTTLVRARSAKIISYSAPGAVLNLGDSDGSVKTQHISLQAGIWNNASNYRMISEIGDGNFPNSFSAGCGNAAPTVISTYFRNASDCGVVFGRNLRLSDPQGPYINTADINAQTALRMVLPYKPGATIGYLPVEISMQLSASPYRDLSVENVACVYLATEADSFNCNRRVEAPSFAVLSEQYKTRLTENALFFDDGIFIAGMNTGMSLNGNAYFQGSAGSTEFTSGFAGYGWSIRQDRMTGSFGATFDEITIRKKMRVHELEIQKTSATNGSLWVTDSCVGDMVEEVA